MRRPWAPVPEEMSGPGQPAARLPGCVLDEPDERLGIVKVAVTLEIQPGRLRLLGEQPGQGRLVDAARFQVRRCHHGTKMAPLRSVTPLLLDLKRALTASGLPQGVESRPM